MGRQQKHWTVLSTKQANSADARKHVADQGFEVLHLMFRAAPVRKVRKVLPLFPYYLLVRIDPRRDDWKVLNNTRGVRNVFLSDGIPCRVADADVQRFRDLENALGYYEHPQHSAPRFEPNATVEVREGWAKGCHGIYQGLVGPTHDRVKVLFSLLGNTFVREMKAFDLVAVT
jgi:transcription antitermination factor NusG